LIVAKGCNNDTDLPGLIIQFKCIVISKLVILVPTALPVQYISDDLRINLWFDKSIKASKGRGQ